MKIMTKHEAKSPELMHIDLQGILDDQCFGDMEIEGEIWKCGSCGEEYTEAEIAEIEKNGIENYY